MQVAFGFRIALVTLASLLSFAAVAGEASDSTAPGTAAAAAPSQVDTKVVATVNGVPITRGELEAVTQMVLSHAGKSGEGATAEQKRQVEDMALDKLITQEVLAQAAQHVQIADLDKQVEDKYNATKARFKTQEAFEQALSQRGTDPAEFKARLAREIRINAYLEREVNAKIAISPEQAREFYDQNPDLFKTPESVHASHILIGVADGASAEEKQAARRKAEDILARIKSGADFAELAKAESSCPSAEQGGDLGSFGRGQMVQPFEDVAFSLDAGALSEVVETQFGFHIIQSQGKTPSEAIAFEQVQEQLQQQIKNQETKKQLAAKIEALKQAARIERPVQAQ